MYLDCTYLEGQLSQTLYLIIKKKQVFKRYVNKSLSKLMQVVLNVYSW